jgi:glutamine synthetase
MNVHRSSLSDESGAARLGANEVDAFLAANPNVQYIDCVFVDLCGNVRGKRVGVGELHKVFGEGLAVPHSIYFLDARGEPVEALGPRSTGAGTAWPVAGSLTRVSWAQRPHGQVLMSLRNQKGEPFFGEPRNVLQRVVSRFAEFDVVSAVGVGIDATIVEGERGKDGAPQPVRSDHGSLASLRDEVLSAAAAQSLGAISVVFDGAQIRVGFAPEAEALAAADHAVFLRQIVRAVARTLKLDAIVMARPVLGRSVNSMRVAMGLRRATGESVFAATSGGDLMRFAVGGLQALMAESLALLVPSVHAFRRFSGPGAAPRNRRWGYGSAWANVSVVTGPEADPHVLHRVASADANPYLALAAALAGVHHGIGQNLDPGQPSDGDLASFVDPTFPMNIDSALLAFENGGVLREYLGPDYVDLYCATKRAELERFRAVIPAHEYDWYA